VMPKLISLADIITTLTEVSMECLFDFCLIPCGESDEAGRFPRLCQGQLYHQSGFVDHTRPRNAKSPCPATSGFLESSGLHNEG
jgi:hypothetical protein